MEPREKRQVIEHLILKIRQIPMNSFKDLVIAEDLDPMEDFRYSELCGLNFSKLDLRGFDFTGTNLDGCMFNHSLIAGARFDVARLNKTDLRQSKDWSDHKVSWKRSDRKNEDDHLEPLSIFRDAPFAPEMIIIPSGKFLMGSTYEGPGTEQPQHKVSIDNSFAVGRFAVTFEEWDFYTSRNKSAHKPNDEGWGRNKRPVINVSWEDAKAYVEWLSEVTGKNYRLLSEAEWEYACLAGENTQYHFGDNEEQLEEYGWYRKNSYCKTQPVGQKKPNLFGLYDMHGNVWEWCEDHYQESYNGAPADGSARKDADEKTSARVLRGGSWNYYPEYLRARRRFGLYRDDRSRYAGFRVGRALSRKK